MAARATLRVLTYIHDEDHDFDAFKKVCRKYGGHYINFSITSRTKRFGFIFVQEENLDAAFQEWRNLCTMPKVAN